MERSEILIGLFLLSLLFSGQSAVEVDEKNLAKIIEVFEARYKPPGQTDSGDGVQYAMAINVPATECAQFNQNSFLSQDNSDSVKEKLKANNLYQGTQLVAATPKGKRSSSKIHSERALLMCTELNQAVTPVKNLLNKDKDGCVVFYTYNSPCLDYCLNQAKDEDERRREAAQRGRGKTDVSPALEKCILNSLSMLSGHRGPKAFVFSRVYRNDKNNPKLADALKKVAEQVPLYKCTTNSCHKCLSGNQIVNQCLS